MRWNKRTETGLVIAVLLMFAGCTTAGSYYTVSFGAGSMTVNNGTFTMDGEISLGTGAQPDATFANISIVFYNNDREVMKKVGVKKLSTKPDVAPLSRHVEVRLDTPPKYVVIESPDFWTSEVKVKVLAYQRTDSGYREYFRERQSQRFPDEKE